MVKKIIVGIVIVCVLVGISVAGIAYYKMYEVQPEQILASYIEHVNKKEYEELYGMITVESQDKISKEDFIDRNKNIYQGIDMSNINMEVLNKVKEDSKVFVIDYKISMNTSIETIEFTNSVKLIKDKEAGYLIEWSSNQILPDLNDTDKVKVKTISAKRGSIYDKNGIVLAEQGNVSSVGIVPNKLGENKEESIQKISELLGITVDEINKDLSASWVKDTYFVPIKSVSKYESELKDALLQIPGIKIKPLEGRVYPSGKASAQLIGYVQSITAEELEKNSGKGYNSNSIIGKSGLEKAYEERLKGKDGKEIYIEDENGNRKKDIAKMDVENGEDIYLTIDSTLQAQLFNELKDDKGLFVVMDPKTGAILSLVSTPSYDPNNFVLGMTIDEWNTIKDDDRNPMMSRYLQTWSPGSTFKTVIGLIGLSSNSLSTEDTFSYNGLSWQKDSSWGKYNITTLTAYDGAKNLRNALIHSDNIYFAQATLKIGKDNFINGLKKIKFGESIEFPLTIGKSKYSNKEDISSETQLADSGYGQGQILINPIHMASIYSSLVNEGNMIKPYIEKGTETQYLVENAFTKEAAEEIKNDLIQVVENPEGTAKDMKVDGRTIAGKTGTAELKDSKDDEAETIGWFDCLTVDSNDNQLLIISMVEDARDIGGSHYLIQKIRSLF